MDGKWGSTLQRRYPNGASYMSTLLVQELWSGITIEQNIKIPRNVSIYAIRPWFYKNGTIPSGTLELSIVEGGNVLATSSLSNDDINNSISGTYAHGSLRFEFPNLVLNIPETQTEKEYKLQFTFSGTADQSNFLGLVKRYEAKTYETYGLDVINNEAPNDAIEPYGLEIFEYTERS